MKKLRAIALYLPQFHPIPENDAWWGKGFTEWTNVARARPRYRGHCQPRLPADLGYYDLRVPEVREQQAEMAREYGIHGFCYYHYWFNGKRILERPFDEVLLSGKPDFPFMLCWANENWTKAWDGGENAILIKQEYSFEDDIKHIRQLVPIFKDSRYIKVNQKPVFCIYRASLFPDIRRTIALWREEAGRANMELYLCGFESFAQEGDELIEMGFDATVEFQPHALKKNGYLKYRNIFNRIINKISRMAISRPIRSELYSYRKYVNYLCKQGMPGYKRYPCVIPNWDNSPRRQGVFFAFKKSTPALYYQWLKYAIDIFKPYGEDENFIFINAWNEWGEGNYLEPDQKWGRAYLEKTKKAILPDKGQ